jgi:hypothetical protein
MKLLHTPEPVWTLHSRDWKQAVARLQSEATFEAAVLLPLIEHFETAWVHLRQLALVAQYTQPAPGVWPLPIHRLAELVLDDLVDSFRGAASEVLLLVPDYLGGDPSPEDVLEEASRFERYLSVAGTAARALPVGELLADTTVRVAAVLGGWSAGLSPLLEPVTEALAATRFARSGGFGHTTSRSDVH